MDEKKPNKKSTEKEQHTQKKKKKYSRAGCIFWALKKMWKLDRWFVFLIFATFLPSVACSLAADYFPGRLIDHIGNGTGFPQLFGACAAFIALNILLHLLKDFFDSRRSSRTYYPTLVYQAEMNARDNYETDYENTFRQDYKETLGYAWNDACSGGCALEYFWREQIGRAHV